MFRPTTGTAVLAAPLLVGALLRVAAASGFGVFASDDYLYVLAPAYDWLVDPNKPYPSHIRSPLLAWIAFGIMRLARSVFATTVNTRVDRSCMHSAVAWWSMVH